MTREEIAESLKLLKEQARKSHKDTAILDVKIESFEWVIESAIKALENHDTFMKYAYSQGKQDALSQEPQCTEHPCLGTLCRYYKEPCTDAVSRRKAISVISACDGKSAQIEALEQLPSVNPQKSGKWIDKEISNPDYPFQDRKIIECSKCHYGIVQARLGYTNYCPNCGSRMESEDKE